MEMATEKAGSLGREGSSKNNPKKRFSSFQDRDAFCWWHAWCSCCAIFNWFTCSDTI